MEIDVLNKKLDEKIKEIKPIKKVTNVKKGLNLTFCLECYLLNDLKIHQVNFYFSISD